VIPAELSDVVRAAQGYADDDERVRHARANLTANMAEITVSEHYLVNAARLEVALADYWTRARLSAMAVQCWPSIQARMGISMCAVYGRLTEQGLLTACETDVLGALAMLVSFQSTMGHTVQHFIDWTIQRDFLSPRRIRQSLENAYHTWPASFSISRPSWWSKRLLAFVGMKFS